MPLSEYFKDNRLGIDKVFEARTEYVKSIRDSDAASNERMGGIAAYSVYGVIVTSIKDDPYTNKMGRTIRILKIRNTKIPIDLISFDITSKGIVLL